MHGNADKLDGKDSSAYFLKDNIVVLRGKATLEANTSGDASTPKSTTFYLDFPNGFDKNNSIVLAFDGKFYNDGRGYSTGIQQSFSQGMISGTVPRSLTLGMATGDENENKIVCHACNYADSEKTFYYRIVLMKYVVSEDEYTLGDVNEDGIIDNNDVQLVQNYVVGTEPYLTEKQYKAADVNKDGEITTRDASLIEDMISKN